MLADRGDVFHIPCLTGPLCFRYRVVVEGERGNRPHIYCLEQLLQEAVCEAKGCLSPVSGLRRVAGRFLLPQLGLQGCPDPASMASLDRAPLGVGRCPVAELPLWQWAVGLCASRDSPLWCPVSGQEAISQQGNCPLSSPELLCYTPGVVGWSVLVPGMSLIAFLLP